MINFYGVGIWIDLLTLICAFFGFIVLIWQNRRRGKIEKCQFMLNLEQPFRDGEKFREVHRKTVEKEKISDTADIHIYLSFFENFYPLIQNKLLKYSEIDKQFGYRFFIATHNEDMQSEITKHKEYFSNLLDLYYEWFHYREKRGLEIPDKNKKLDKSQLEK